MTVAIAALIGRGSSTMVLCAEDHMITTGDVKFEQPQPKIWQLGRATVAMVFGDTSAQSEIAAQTEDDVLADGLSATRDIANRYAFNLRAYIRTRAETDVLSPLGLTTQSFLKYQASMHPGLVESVKAQLLRYYDQSGLGESLGGAIVAGSDARGGHIYRIEHGKADFMDAVGFAAAGSGQWHAESQFMISRYTRDWDFPSVLSMIFTAKKRAEVAPGVGNETDLVIMGTLPSGPYLTHIKAFDPMMQRLEAIYEETQKRRALAENYLHHEVKTFMETMLRTVPQAPESTQTDGGTPPVAEVVEAKPILLASQEEVSRVPRRSTRGRKGQPPSPE